MADPDVDNAKGWAVAYRRLGLTPLPSRSDEKAPDMGSYAKHYGNVPVPSAVYSDWRSRNIQLITGVKSPATTKVMAVDIDGPDALVAWDRICQFNGYEWRNKKCWRVSTGSGGTHLYFQIPLVCGSCISGLIWAYYDTFGTDGKGDWAKHKEIRIVGDRGLAIAPPSLHVDTGEPYRFDPVQHPDRFPVPATAPQWLLEMKRIKSRPRWDTPVPVMPRIIKYEKPIVGGRHYGRETVLRAMSGDLLTIAHEWGLVTVSEPNTGGWTKCYVPIREVVGQSRPSGSFSVRDGVLLDMKDHESYSFFDLGVMLGKFEHWQECVNSLGQRYLGQNEKS